MAEEKKGKTDFIKMLDEHVTDHEGIGSIRVDGCLGIQKMPKGYALMKDMGEPYYFYWLRYDGIASLIHWDKWACYRGAKSNKKKLCQI